MASMMRRLRLCTMALCTTLLAATAAAQASAHGAPADLRTVVDGTALRATPDAAGPVVDRLRAGQQVKVLHTSADGLWLRIARPDGTVWGYVSAQALAAGGPAATPPGGAAGSGSLFARSLGLATGSGASTAAAAASAPAATAPAAVPVPATEPATATAAMPAEGSLFSNQVLRGDIAAAHAQLREEERLAAIRKAEEERARQLAEAQREQEDKREREAEAARDRERQRQREYERARDSARARLALQRQWADAQSSMQRITQDVQREADKTTRLLQEHARQKAQQRRDHEQAQKEARAQAQAQADARADAKSRAQQEARARAEAQAAARAQAAQERARQQQALADARQRAAALAPSFQAAPGFAGAASPPSAQVALAPPAARAQPPAPASGTSGAGVRIAAVQRDPGDGQPGRGSMRKEGLRVGSCAVQSIQVEWSLGVLMGEATVAGTYSWQGVADCRLPSSTVVLLRLDAAGLPGGWLALSPTVPQAGARGFNVSGSPALSALLCRYDHARRGDCLGADVARSVWKDGQVSDFVVAW